MGSEMCIRDRDIVEHLKQGFSFLLTYYDYFVTLDGDPDPREL